MDATGTLERAAEQVTPRTCAPHVGASRARRGWADFSGAAVLANLTAVVALWIYHGGVAALAGSDHGLTSVGRLTGLLAAVLLLLQVLLMARIPWIERWYGQDRLARRHRAVGHASFWLLVVHVVAITAGYAATAHTGALAQIRALVLDYPGMLLAAAGTALIGLVIVTSVRASRRRLRYESWHLIHLYAYVGVALGVPHQLWTGTDFISSPIARGYWWSLYALAAGSMLVFRVGLPIWRTLRHRLVVTKTVMEAPGVVSIHMRGRRLDRLPVRAGQFFIWRFRSGRGWSRGHPYSLSAPPDGDCLRITVKDLGDGSRRAAAIRPGTRVLIEGPYGAMTAARSQGRAVVAFAAGVGITAIRALLGDADMASRPVTVLYRTSGSNAVFAAELDDFAQRGVRVVSLTGPRAIGSFLPAHLVCHGDAAMLRRLVPDVAERDAYVCGPPEWMAAVRRALREVGMPPANIHVEDFAW